MLGDISVVGLLTMVLLGFLIATTVNTLAMEAAVLFVPAFQFVFPRLVPGFPWVGVNVAIGLALFVELFGYSSSVTAYWFRKQIDFHIAGKLLAITVPLAVLARTISYLLPNAVLELLFGGLLVVLAVVLYESHEHGPSILDRLWEMPVASLSGTDVPEDYEPRTRVTADGGETAGGTREGFHLEPLDLGMMGLGGALAGLVGIAVGELTQVMLNVRKKIPIQLSTGTAAFVLHLTILAALVTNIGLLTFAPSMTRGFTVPFDLGIFVAMGCLFGGQAGAYLNSRLDESTVIWLLIVAYALVGVFVTAEVLLLGGH
jgi:uncharacterized membrane protein YfcA